MKLEPCYPAPLAEVTLTAPVLRILVAAGLAISWERPAWAEDLTVVINGSGSGRNATLTEYVSGDQVRIAEEAVDTIYDTARGRIVRMNTREKTYFETSRQEIEAGLATASHKVDANTGAKAEPNPATKVSGPVTTDKRSGVKRIAGYVCEPYVLSMGDDVKWEVWVARDLEAPAQLYEAQVLAAARMGRLGARLVAMLQELRKIKGMPMSQARAERQGSMLSVYTIQVADVRKGPLPAASFQVPAGYKKTESPYVRMRRPLPTAPPSPANN